jgi:hypothetical protein
MPERRRLALQLHAAIVLFLGLLAGWPYNLSLVHGWGVDAQRAWALAHEAGALCGAMGLAVCAAFPTLRLPRRAARALGLSVATSLWAFTSGMWLCALARVRGLVPTDSPADGLANALYLLAASSGLLGGALLVAGAAAAWRSAGDEPGPGAPIA